MDGNRTEDTASNGQSLEISSRLAKLELSDDSSATQTTDESQAKSQPPRALTQARIAVQALDYWVNRWLSQTDITPDSDDMSAEQIRSIGCDPLLKLIAKATEGVTAVMTGPPNHWPMTRWEPKDVTKLPKTQKYIRDRIDYWINVLIYAAIGVEYGGRCGGLAYSIEDEFRSLTDWPGWEHFREKHPSEELNLRFM